jgi:hypothetical protein
MSAQQDMKAEIRSAFQALSQLHCEQRSKLAKALSILEKIIGNILEHPSVDKYRCLNEENPTLFRDFFSVDGCLGLLHLIGFERHGSKLKLEHKLAKRADELQIAILRDALGNLQIFVKENFVKEHPDSVNELVKEHVKENPATVKACDSAELMHEVRAASLVVTLQSLTNSKDVSVPTDATVSDLRACAAKWRGCEEHQVRLVQVSEETPQRLDCDCMKLEDCGIKDNSIVIVSVGALDEFVVARKKLEDCKRYLSVPEPEPDTSDLPTIGVDEFTHTRKYLDVAAATGMHLEDLQALKRCLNMKDMSPKDVREAVKADLMERLGCVDMLETIDDEARSAIAEVTQKVDKVKASEAHGRETALNNFRGLQQMAARQRSHASQCM